MAVGNPPWVKVEFDERAIMSEIYPELVIRNLSSPKVKELRDIIKDEVDVRSWLMKM